jgi:uncharacterized protein YndB with AHSA1/START domain
LIMKKLHFEISINAPKEKVWDAMLSPDTYREWTAEFMPGSHYEGSWDLGSKISFLGPSPETGKTGGMVAKVIANRPYEYISTEVTAVVGDGVEDATSEFAKPWVGGTESYTFTELNGVTNLSVDITTNASEEDAKMFSESWPQALAKLKEIAER